MTPKDLYKILGVPETASASEIKKAYRKLAKRFHPDATGGDKKKEARFKEISEAYEVLGDEKKRAAYDEARRNPFGRAGGFPGGDAGGGFGQGSPFGNIDFGDLFSQYGQGRVHVEGSGGYSDLFEIFGGSRARRAPARGEDVVMRLEVELPEAALGAEKSIRIDRRRLTVKIPAGVTSGKTIRLAGQGHPGPSGGAPGDLLIELQERPHPRFRRRVTASGPDASGDIEVDLPISIEEAVLGGKTEVPTLEGSTVTVTIPPGSSSGQRLRLKGKGAQVKGGRGDLHAVVSVQVPREVPARARELIQEFSRLTRKS